MICCAHCVDRFIEHDNQFQEPWKPDKLNKTKKRIRRIEMNPINWSRIHERKEGNAFSFLLSMLSVVYGLAVQLRLIAYKVGLLRSRSLQAYVVSVGNLTVGGTGKTPCVAMLAAWASENRFKSAILSRGYRGRRSSDSHVVSNGAEVLASVEDAGDEPVLLARKVSSVPVVIGKKRHAAGTVAIAQFEPELLLLDDGYQHLSLQRDLNILLIDAKRRFGNGFLLPRGPLREPLTQIKRADLIVITKCTAATAGDDAVDLLRRDFPEKLIFRSALLPDQVKFPLTGKIFPPDFLSGKRVIVFAGLAHPHDFLDMVESLGAQVIHHEGFPDHHTFTQGEIAAHVSRKKRSDVDFLVTTEKDWVRIEGKYDVGEEIAVLTVRMRLLSEADSFFDIIRKGILGFDAEGA